MHFSAARLSAALLLPLAALMAPGAAAQDSGVAYVGGTAGDGANGYGGVVVALPGNRLGKGLAVRGGVSGGEYRYDINGQRIDATYVSGELALVYQTSGEWGWANFSAGPRVSHTSLSPNDPGNRLRGTRVDAALQTDGAYGNRWRLGWFGSLGVNDLTYIGQLRLSRLVDEQSGTRLGLEGQIQGDRSYTRGGGGAFASTRIGTGLEALLAGGFTEQAGRGAKPYVSVALSKVF